ncbi:hypothetical protein PRIPAC_81603 [Pristionchus pacificus]|nr:hypothetical protein PRIPAC_81603 [Pristionchus pacificus]
MEILSFQMNGLIAVQFMRLFQNALFVETDRRVWTKLHECFRLLYAQCEAEYYMNICERMYQTVAASAADKLDKMGWQEKSTDNVDDAYIRYICADLVLFDCQTENIAKLYKTYEEMKFSFVSPLRIAVWTRVVREDDLSNEMNLLQFLFEESKLPRVKLPNEEYGTKLQHLIYAASTSKDNIFTKELWKRLVTEKEITPADLVFVFKGTMIYPSARKRCLDLFMEEAFFREKIPSDSPEYKEILRLFANSCVREAELLKIKDHVMADFAFTDADKKSFDFEMLEKRMEIFVKGVAHLHATMNKYLIEDRDFLVHKK